MEYKCEKVEENNNDIKKFFSWYGIGISICVIIALLFVLPMVLTIKFSPWFLFLYCIPIGIILGLIMWEQYGDD